MRAWVIGDGQWGSTGKGLIAAHIARTWKPDATVCNFGPNAGHTWVMEEGARVIVKQLPMAIVSESVKRVFIGPGAIIDPVLLHKELEKFSLFLENKELIIHERAAVVLPEHKEQEASKLASISSTFQGTGAALAAKVLREPSGIIGDYAGFKRFCVGTHDYMRMLAESEALQIESAQGLELGLNSGSHYPYCTSRDISPQQVYADVLLPVEIEPWRIVTMRTYPIRVGDQYQDGVKVGTSGPVYDDHKEISWADLGVEEERTTVTNKVRRVFTWSWANAAKVRQVWKPDYVFLNFMNYLDKNAKGSNDMDPKCWSFISNVEQVMGARVRWLGFGPKSSQISELGEHLKVPTDAPASVGV